MTYIDDLNPMVKDEEEPCRYCDKEDTEHLCDDCEEDLKADYRHE